VAVDNEPCVDFRLPSLGSDMEEGTVIEWLVGVGDEVTKGQVLLRVDTEKADIDVEVWHEAVVLELLVGAGDTIPVGTPLARLGSDRAAGADDSPPTMPSVEPDVVPESEDEAGMSEVSTEAASQGTASEAVVVELAQDPDVSPRLVYWPSPAVGPVTVRRSEEPVPPSKPAVDDAPRSRAERRQAAVASLMERSNRDIPHFHLIRSIDLTEMLGWLDARNESLPPTERILPSAVLMYGVARAASGSVINGMFDEGPIDAAQVDLRIAVHVRGGGLITPVLPAADQMPLDTFMQELQAVVGRARSNRMNAKDMTPATLTVTNLGDSGTDAVMGVIRPPERALVGFGRVAERAVVVDGELAVRSTVEVTLSADHRVINGRAGARFLDALNSVLTNPNAITFAGDNV
jgi:pyruvate dehydrogenase E2 component (dihydrolipoamide acetyltransferase)